MPNDATPEEQKRAREAKLAISALQTLESLVAKFNVEAGQGVKAATALKAAADVIRTALQRNQELEQKLAELEKADAPSQGKHAKADNAPKAPAQPQGKSQGKSLIVLIDGSASMEVARQGKAAPLQRALDATLELSTAGANVSAILWGDGTLVPINATKENFEKFSGGLLSGSEFSPVVDYMKEAAPQNYIIVSDGEFYDKKDVLLETLKFLSANPKATLDFVFVTERKDTTMHAFAQTLEGQYPAQVKCHAATKEVNVASVLTAIADSHDALPKLEPKQYYMTINKNVPR